MRMLNYMPILFSLYTNIILLRWHNRVLSTALCPDSTTGTFYRFVELVEAHLNFPFMSVRPLLCYVLESWWSVVSIM